jgi:hypothetical protein
MSRPRIAFLLLIAFVLPSSVALAQISAQPTTGLPSEMPTETNRPVSINGKVVLEDGTPAGEPVEVQRVCGNIVQGQAYSDSRGNFTILMDDKSNPAFQSASEGGGATQLGAQIGSHTSQTTRTQLWGCDIRAQLPGYTAGLVSLAGRDFSTPVNLNPIVLHRVGNAAGNSISATAALAPANARKEFDKARDDFSKKKFADADKHLAKAVEFYPNYASALDLRGREQRAQKLDAEAEKSFLAALKADEKYIPPYLHLAALNATRANWAEVLRLSNRAIELDPANYTEPYYYKTVAHLMLKQVPEAKQSVAKVLEMDNEHRFNRAELIMGNILRSEGDIAGASVHYRNYVKLEPKSPDAPNIQEYLASLDKKGAEPNSAPKSN